MAPYRASFTLEFLNPATKMILLNSNSGTESFVQTLQYFPSHFELGTSLQRGQSELPQTPYLWDLISY